VGQLLLKFRNPGGNPRPPHKWKYINQEARGFMEILRSKSPLGKAVSNFHYIPDGTCVWPVRNFPGQSRITCPGFSNDPITLSNNNLHQTGPGVERILSRGVPQWWYFISPSPKKTTRKTFFYWKVNSKTWNFKTQCGLWPIPASLLFRRPWIPNTIVNINVNRNRPITDHSRRIWSLPRSLSCPSSTFLSDTCKPPFADK